MPITKTLRQDYEERVLAAIRESLAWEQQPEAFAEGVAAIGLTRNMDVKEAVQWIHHRGHKKHTLANFDSYAAQVQEARARLKEFDPPREICHDCGVELLHHNATLYCPSCGSVRPA
jgi:rubrerythrin